MLTDKRPMSKIECNQIHPVVLAFVGDAVYTLYVKERLVLSGEGKVGEFQRASAQIVSARGQSAFLDKILPMLTEEETHIFKRGKSAKKATKSKSASSLEYNRSTGFEALLGYLYLTGEEDRIRELLSHSNEEDFKRIEAVKAFKP